MALIRFFSRMNMRSQFTAAMLLLVLFAAGAVAAVGYSVLSRHIAAEIHSKTLWSLRDAVTIVADTMPQFSIETNAEGEPERLRANLGGLPDPFMSGRPLDSIVDTITAINKNTATLFRWDRAKQDFERIATTVRKPDGSRAVGTYLGKESAAYAPIMARSAYRGIAKILGEDYQTGYLPIVGPNDDPIGIVYIGVGKIKDFEKANALFIQNLAMLTGIALILATGVALLVSRAVVRPFAILAQANDRIVAGHEGIIVPYVQRSDELGSIARSIEGFQEAIRIRKLAEDDRQREAQRIGERKEKLERAIAGFQRRIEVLMTEMRQGAGAVRETSQQIIAVIGKAGHSVDEARKAADDGVEAVNSVAGATDQFAKSISEIASQTNDAAQIVRRASEAGLRASETVAELSSVVEKIEDTVVTIRSIADQTNLLALNATIEAARAGDAGRGFAVVAAEVKGLSMETAKATTQISELVATIQGVTRAVIEATAGIRQDLTTIDQSTMVVAAAVTEQESVTQDIAVSAARAAGGSGTMREGFTSVEDAIASTRASANALEGIAETVSQSSTRIVQEIEGFLVDVAA